MPRSIAYQYACAGLFTGRESAWGQAAYLIKHEGSTAWSEVPRDVVSPMPVAGYRQRMDRIMTEVRRSRVNKEIYPMIAAHVAIRYAETFPCQPPVAEVRLVNSLWRTSEPVMTHPIGRWRLPPGDVIDKAHVSTVAVFRREGKQWKDISQPKSRVESLNAATPVNTQPPRPMRASPFSGTSATGRSAKNPMPFNPGEFLSKKMWLPPLPKAAVPQPPSPAPAKP